MEKGKVLLKFYADWCGPCKMMNPIADQFEEESGIEVIHINIEEDEELTEKYSVSSIPTLIRLEDGVEVDRAMGFMPLPRLEQFMK